MIRRYAPFILFVLLACNADTDGLFPTITPTGGAGSTASPSAPTTTFVATMKSVEEVTPTPICPEGSICIQPTYIATQLGKESWEFIKWGFMKIRCVAQSDFDAPVSCRVRDQPTIESNYRTVPNGTEFEVKAYYHCEVYIRCDSLYPNWYKTLGGEWAVAEEYIWKELIVDSVPD